MLIFRISLLVCSLIFEVSVCLGQMQYQFNQEIAAQYNAKYNPRIQKWSFEISTDSIIGINHIPGDSITEVYYINSNKQIHSISERTAMTNMLDSSFVFESLWKFYYDDSLRLVRKEQSYYGHVDLIQWFKYDSMGILNTIVTKQTTLFKKNTDMGFDTVMSKDHWDVSEDSNHHQYYRLQGSEALWTRFEYDDQNRICAIMRYLGHPSNGCLRYSHVNYEKIKIRYDSDGWIRKKTGISYRQMAGKQRLHPLRHTRWKVKFQYRHIN